jgi:hypothetical protein
MTLAPIDLLGYAAAGLVLATFCMRDMVALRWMAIASNLAFIAYGGLAGLGPVLVLHLLLLPVNVLRLAGSNRSARRDTPADATSTQRPTASTSRSSRESTMRRTQGDGHGLPGRERFSR